VWVDLLGQWHDRLVRICAEAIRAGIEERRVRIAEQQGALVADVIRKILERLELTPEQAAKAGDVVPFELRRSPADADRGFHTGGYTDREAR
jgi:NADH dehydrogenase FAD-containing subunit